MQYSDRKHWEVGFRCFSYWLLRAAVLLLLAYSAPSVIADSEIDFSRDVLPILSDACFKCHGPDDDSREADLRFDDEQSAKLDRGGYAAVKPGDADKSELILRILSDDEYEMMPPPDSGKELSAQQKELLRGWVEQGAPWSTHWAFITPKRPPVPALPEDAPDNWSKNPIDAFVFEKIGKAKLSPSPVASPETLLRRVYLDLIGLPPTLQERKAFLSDTQPDAYKRIVDRLLDSPHYGERWGRHWLDAARYSDSDGYEKDLRRTNWFYRDWVINALNADKPYDEFIIEQIAGDLLPQADQDDVVATGFLRNSMVNEEGGADPEQFRVEGLFDRMDAVGKAILGLTTQCAQCHSHKYDPLTHEEYFGLFAYLNNCNESTIAVYTPDEQAQIQSIRRQILEREDDLRGLMPTWREELVEWAKDNQYQSAQWTVLRVERENYTGQKFALLDDGSLLSQSYAPPRETNSFFSESVPERITAVRLELLTHPDLPRGGPGRSVFGTNALTEFEIAYVDAEGIQHDVEIASATANLSIPKRKLGEPFIDEREGPEERVVGPIAYAIDGDDKTAWTTNTTPAVRNQSSNAVFVLSRPIEESRRLILRLKQAHGGKFGNQRHSNIAGRFRFSTTSSAQAVADPLPSSIRKIVSRESPEWDELDWDSAFSYWRHTRPEWNAVNTEIDQLLSRYPEGTSQYVISETSETSRRTTYRMDRGNFLSPSEVVEPHTPRFLHPLPDDAPANRLTFARWLVDRQSPTTARAMVNRVWQAYFGTGIVETTEDLGSQSSHPSHPELLDWLAVEFMESGWSLKHLHRLILTSATYRQSSAASRVKREADPYNRLLARGPRVRVDAEVVRDIALSASGLLDSQIGGPSIYPPAPRFLFLPPASYGEKPWESSDGNEQHRRSLYVQAYRSVPFPPLQVFDAPNGNASCVRRTRSNTPIQALTLLNEPQFVECSQALAQRLLDTDSDSHHDKVITAYLLLLSREPTHAEIETVLEFFKESRKQLESGKLDAVAIAGLPEDAERDHALDLAAWTLVSRCLLNLDETITNQ